MASFDEIFEAAVRAYEFASGEEAVSQHGLRAAVRRALEIQREEIALAIEALGDGAIYVEQAAQTARAHGKEN